MAMKHLVWAEPDDHGPAWDPPANWTIFRIGINGGERDDRLFKLRDWLNSSEVPGLYVWRLSVPPEQMRAQNSTDWEHTLEVAMSDRNAAFETKLRFG